MREQLKQVDTSVIDELMEIKREREMVAERLARMNNEQGKVSDVVYRRVRRDYETKASELERKAAPLKERARQEYAKLKSMLDRLQSQHNATRLDREEVDFRHRLGEFPDADYEKRVAELDGRVAEQEDQLTEIGEVRTRFVDAFDSEEELAAPPAPTPPAAPAEPAPARPPAPAAAVFDPSAVTAPQPIEPPTAPPPAPAPAAAAAPPPAPNGTVILPSEGPAPASAAPAAAAEPAVGRTVVLALAKLVAVDSDLGASEFPLQPLSFIGRTPDNQVRLNKPAVSRRHAQISQSDKGWTIKDLQSENGSYVNGEKIGERPLADGDRVQIGTVRLVFKLG
jgi:uncharacterized coiled-coil protein SlyX